MCLVLVFATSRGGYGTGTAALLASFFTLVCSGSSLFGLLTTSAAQRLGRVSYSLYLMQGLVLTLVLGTAPVRSVAMASHLAYWAIGIGCACVLLVAAAIGYSSVEKPCIAFGTPDMAPCACSSRVQIYVFHGYKIKFYLIA